MSLEVLVHERRSSGVNSVTRVQILNEAVCILHSAKTFEKGMNPTILPPFMDK